jgi:N-acetylglucosaminyl-diphospho-decaprenol L-rhamnosyltransferase
MAKDTLPSVSILVVSWNTCALLRECLASIYETRVDENIQVIVLDNASSDGSAEMVEQEFPETRLIRSQENLGFARGNNQAATQASGEYLLLLNSDARLQPGALEELLSFAQQHPQASVVGACLINPDGSFQFSYADFPTLWREFLILSTLGRKIFGQHYPSHKAEKAEGPRRVDYVNGACLLINRGVYQQAGGLPSEYFMYAEEVDFCLTVKQNGGQVWYHPGVQVVHHGGASSQNRKTAREGDMYQSRVRLMRKYRGNLAAWLLKVEIVGLTAPKVIWHGLRRWLSHGKYGRPVISLHQLFSKLREV